MLWEPLQWFISLVEVITVMAAILVVGLIIAMAAFWVLSQSLGKLAGAPAEPDPDEHETDGGLAATPSQTGPNDTSAPAEPGI